MDSKKFYLGLDIGTNSVGWAATDENYKLLKYKENKTWGSCIFDSSEQAAERRGFRTARRRGERKKQRTILLNELFAKEILKVDEDFFIRMRESALWADDKTVKSEFDTYNVPYHLGGKCHTIHHLIDELMENKKEHDIRLVYLACKYLVSHRGHFLYPVDENNIEAVTDFGRIYEEFLGWFDSAPWDCDKDKFKEVLCKKTGINNKLKMFTELLWGGKKPKSESEENTVDIYSVVNLICGGKVELSKIFGVEEYTELETNKITLNNSEAVDTAISVIESGHADLIRCCKNIFDWALLTDELGESSTISKAKIRKFEQHKSDLELLKRIIKKYLPKKYYEVFRKGDTKLSNYTAYSANFKGVQNRNDCKKATQEEFCGYLKKLMTSVKPDAEDEEVFNDMTARISNNEFCPKQVNTDNRVIPYQLYYYELRVVLENACAYLKFLNESDEYGTVKDKILSIMKFRVPYYVGPLNSHSEKSWIKRKAEGHIYPWNFDQIVDKDLSEEEFIRRMTCKCTYLSEYSVLPKNSLLYSKFTVLNEINNIRINDVGISVDTKQKIYNELFMKKKSVSLSAIKAFLQNENILKDDDILSGIDTTVKSSLKSYHAFKNLIVGGILNEDEVEEIILRITCTEDKPRLKKWLRENFRLSEDNIKYVSGLRFSDFGRLSKELLTEILSVDIKTGEVTGCNIITAMWETNENLMQLLSNIYGYRNSVEAANMKFYSENQRTLSDRLEEMSISPAVRRPIIRTLDIVKDIRKCIGKDPDKIFIETARELDYGDKKGKRTDSRRKKIEDLYKNVKDDISLLKKQLEKATDDELRGEKLFLYFIQLGRCMYSGKVIDINDLHTKSYDIDHIFPQSLIKDDSIDNKVLVLSELNGQKSDKYPINVDIRNKMRGLWEVYRDKNLISEKKYIRLTRSTMFTDDELAGFISRQIVETRQSIKAVAQLLKEYYPNTEIVYVKAGLTSEFRQNHNMLKCRDINDLHHAKDAYLNIVMGNVYNTKFTKNPINFIKNRNGEKYSLNLNKMLFDSNGKSRQIERNGVVAWKSDDSTFETVRTTMAKNAIIYNKYCFVRKGGLFDINPLKAQKNDALLPRKKNLPVEKYGGYNNMTAACFAPVKYSADSGRKGFAIICIELLYLDKYLNDNDFAVNYAKGCLEKLVLEKKETEIVSMEFPFGKRLIKIGTLVEIDGFRAFLMSKSDKGAKITISSALPLVLSAHEEEYIRRLSAFREKKKANPNHILDEKRDCITSERNIQLFDKLCEKLSDKKYSVKFSDMCKKISGTKGKFVSLDVERQAYVLLNVADILKTNRSNTCDFESLGLAKNAGIIKLGTNFSKLTDAKSIYIIDKSPSGLIEKRSANLLEL